jgi:7-cyano-7-deazaguanine reductase
MADPIHLGQSSRLPASPEAAVLDYVPNPRSGTLYLVRFAAPEFTKTSPSASASALLPR